MLSGSRYATIGLALGIVILSPLDAQSTRIAGVVKNAAGEAVAGALVKVKSESTGLGFMVVSQEQGRYSTPNVLPGKYVVQGFGGTHRSAADSIVEVGSGEQAKVELILSAPLQISRPVKRLIDDEYEKLMPEEDAKGAKHSLSHQCNVCHTLEPVVSARKTREKWRQTIDRMRDFEIEDRHPLWLRFPEDELLDSLWLDYLSTNFGPDVPQNPQIVRQWLLRPGSPSHPNRNLPPVLLQGAAAKYVAMEFSLPFDSAPGDIAIDSQGIAWISEGNTGMIGRFDPNSLSYTRIAPPPGMSSKSNLNSVAVDSRDQVWSVDDGPNARILQYDPKSREFNSYPIPDFRWPVPDDMNWARIGTLRFLDGEVWATGMTSDRILRLDPGSRSILDYSIPRGSVPFGLAIGKDHMIWYAGKAGNTIVRLDPNTGRISQHSPPTKRSELRGLATDREGNLWVAANDSGKLVKFDSGSAKVTEYTPPTEDSGPYAVDVDKKRNLVWFSEIFADRITKFDPADNSFVEYSEPTADLDVQRIEIDRTDPNRVWWSAPHANKIGYIEVIE